MSRLRVAPIVEGHGEQEAVRILLTRIWIEVLGGEYLEVLKPIRQPRSKLVRKQELTRAINLAMLKLGASTSNDPSLVLVMLDADDDLPCVLGPDLLTIAHESRRDADISCVVVNVEYETWFVASAESLTKYLEVGDIPAAPEDQRCGKAWIEKRYRGAKYSETVDQPAMTAAMDLERCRSRSPSFDKLCRELGARLSPA